MVCGELVEVAGYTNAFFFYYWWSGTKSLSTAVIFGPLYKPQMIDDS
jgi:hypothetical protein